MRLVSLVDPDLDALAELASALRSRGLIVTVFDALAPALERAAQHPPDVLLIAEALAAPLAQLRGRAPVLAQLPCYLLLAPGRVAQHAQQLPWDAEQIAQRVLAVSSRRSAPDVLVRGDFRGDLSQLGLPDLLQLLGANRQTGVLSVNTTQGAAEIWFSEGELVDVVYRRLEGEKALFRLLGEADGSFTFSTAGSTPARRLAATTQHLLMEGLRQGDEARALRGRLALEGQVLVRWGPPELPDDPPDARRVLEALSAARSLDELLDEVPLTDLELLRCVERLQRGGRLRGVPRGGLEVALADDEQLAVLGARVTRCLRGGFRAPPRLGFYAAPPRLALLAATALRLREAAAPADLVPTAPVPHVLATLRLGSDVQLDLLGVPALEAYAPLWSLMLPGSIAIVCFEPPTPALEELGALGGLRLLPVAELEPGEAADPPSLARLVRRALEVLSD